jgi:hypothetical protein
MPALSRKILSWMARKNNTVLKEADPKTRLELTKGTQDCFARGPTPSNQSRKVATSQGARTQADCSWCSVQVAE